MSIYLSISTNMFVPQLNATLPKYLVPISTKSFLFLLICLYLTRFLGDK